MEVEILLDGKRIWSGLLDSVTRRVRETVVLWTVVDLRVGVYRSGVDCSLL